MVRELIVVLRESVGSFVVVEASGMTALSLVPGAPALQFVPVAQTLSVAPVHVVVTAHSVFPPRKVVRRRRTKTILFTKRSP